MPESIRVDKKKQAELITFVSDNFSDFKSLSETRRSRLLEIFQEYTTFTEEREAERETTFKVNKAHEIVNKILPRIMAKNPKWLVSARTNEFNKDKDPEKGAQKKVEMNELARGVQDYLTYIFDRYSQREPLRIWAKNMLIYGNSYAKVKFKYEIARSIDYDVVEEKKDGEKTKRKQKKVLEDVVGEYPTIEPKSWTDVYVDPRYVLFEDMPGIIEVTHSVRLAQLKSNKSKYMNLDKVSKMPDANEFQNDPEGYKNTMYQITGVDQSGRTAPVDKQNLIVKTYYGAFTYKGEERLYEIATVDDSVLISFAEITHVPMEDIKCFDGTETHFATGFVEPILGLQQEMNFKKNSTSEYINQALNRNWIWSPNSGVNPADLVSKPGNIIATSKTAAEALNNISELPHRSIPFEYFQEQNDIERQIQGATFTVDTSNARSQQALTNTATGIRVKFFESNSVIDEIRKHFEEGMEKLAYKLLQCTYENMEDNIVIKKTDSEGYREINKELLRDAIRRYEIKVEVASSSFDSIESRREDAIAARNMMLQAKQAGIEVNLEEAFKDILHSFEKKDVNRFIKQTNMLQGLLQNAGGTVARSQIKPEEESDPTNAAELTQQVAQGGLTAGL